jgi:hypothetical protein
MIRFMISSALAVSVAGIAVAEDQGGMAKSGFRRTGQLGGPSSVTAQLEEDDEIKKTAFRFPWFDRTLQPWFDFKGRLNNRNGLQLGAAYTMLYQGASTAPAARRTRRRSASPGSSVSGLS